MFFYRGRWKSNQKRLAIYGLLTLVIFWGVVIEPRLLLKRELVVTSSEWQGMPLKVAFVSDLHVGFAHTGLEQLDNLIRRINEVQPEIILLGGDFIGQSLSGETWGAIEEIAARLALLEAPLGVFAVLGNHDWWHDGLAVRQALERHGVQVLENEAVFLKQDHEYFALIGIGDDMTGHADPVRAAMKVPQSLPRVVLMHDPASYVDLDVPAALVLAGHTHGGQIRLPLLGAIVVPGRASREYAYGLIKRGKGPLYVTSGVGTSIVPIRLFAPPEFVVITLMRQ